MQLERQGSMLYLLKSLYRYAIWRKKKMATLERIAILLVQCPELAGVRIFYLKTWLQLLSFSAFNN